MYIYVMKKYYLPIADVGKLNDCNFDKRDFFNLSVCWLVGLVIFVDGVL